MIGLAAIALLGATMPANLAIGDLPALRHASVKRTSLPPAEAVLPKEAGRLPLSYGNSPKPHFYDSFGSKDTKSIVLVDLPLAISESELTHMQYGIERLHVQPHTLLIDSSGRRFEIDVAIPPDADVFVHESGTIVMATPQTLERITVRLPK